MAVKGFTFYLTYWDVGNEISEEERGLYYCAIMDYMFADIDREAELPFQARIAFKAVKANLKTSKNRSEAGKLGQGISKSKTNESKSKANEKQNKASSISSSISSSSSMSNSAQYKARKFDQPCGSGEEANAAADDWSLSDDDMRELERELAW